MGVEARILDTGGSYFNLVETDASGAFTFDPLSAGACDVTLGDAVSVVAGSAIPDIDFTLVSAPLLTDDFEDGTTAAW